MTFPTRDETPSREQKLTALAVLLCAAYLVSGDFAAHTYHKNYANIFPEISAVQKAIAAALALLCLCVVWRNLSAQQAALPSP